MKTFKVRKKNSSFQNQEKKPIYLLFILEDLFYKSSLTIQCRLGNKIKVTTLVDNRDTGYVLIDEKFAKIVS